MLFSNLASHCGSRANFISICLQRSIIVGIPNGLVLPLLFGMYTRLILEAFPSNVNLSISPNLSSGFIDFIPSIPAVDLPWLSCVIRLMASNFAFN